MKVSELIEYLERLQQDAEVVTGTSLSTLVRVSKSPGIVYAYPAHGRLVLGAEYVARSFKEYGLSANMKKFGVKIIEGEEARPVVLIS